MIGQVSFIMHNTLSNSIANQNDLPPPHPSSNSHGIKLELFFLFLFLFFLLQTKEINLTINREEKNPKRRKRE